MNAGDLREQIRFEVEQRTPNGQGGFTTLWVPVAKAADVRAEIILLTGDESIQAGVERGIQRWRVRVRKRTDLTTANRIVWGQLLLDIRAVAADPRDRAATLLICESGAAG